MTILTIQLRPETEQKLRERAALTGVTLEKYLHQLIEHAAEESDANGAAPGEKPPSGGQQSADAWVASLKAWAASHQSLPTLADDSRESIYEGRGE